MRRYTAHGRLMEDTEPDLECFFVHYSDAQDAIRKLRGELSLAEEGLANYALEVERLQALLTRARNGFVGHLCTDGKPHGMEQDASITCLRCEIDSVLHPKGNPHGQS